MSLVFDTSLYMNGGAGGGVSLDKIIVKSDTIPAAAAKYVGAVYQYVGETNSTYTHGYIYECKAVVESDTTSYVWERIDVQPGATRGRFLALWNCATGLAESNPPSSPYPYGVGDYYIVGTVGTTNYKPSGSSYVIGTASTIVETNDVAVNDTYYYDGTNWNLQKNSGVDFSEYLKKHQIDTNGNYTSEFEYSPADSENPTTDVTVWYKNNGYAYFGSLRASDTGVSLVGQGRSGAHLTQNGQYFVTNTPIKSNFYTVGEGTIITKGYLANNYPDNSSLVYNDNNYSLEVKGVKNSEFTDSSTTLKIWEGNSTEYTEDQQSKTYYAWREVAGEDILIFYTLTATPSVGDLVAYNTPDLFRFEITATDGSTYIEIFDGEDHAERYSEGDITRTATIDANTICFVEGVGVKRNGVDIATKITLDSVPTQGSTNGITSGAVYTVLGDLETALHNINSGS